jgi:hypothetical protein
VVVLTNYGDDFYIKGGELVGVEIIDAWKVMIDNN